MNCYICRNKEDLLHCYRSTIDILSTLYGRPLDTADAVIVTFNLDTYEEESYLARNLPSDLLVEGLEAIASRTDASEPRFLDRVLAVQVC